jgi:hypothetical protein
VSEIVFIKDGMYITFVFLWSCPVLVCLWRCHVHNLCRQSIKSKQVDDTQKDRCIQGFFHDAGYQPILSMYVIDYQICDI